MACRARLSEPNCQYLMMNTRKKRIAMGATSLLVLSLTAALVPTSAQAADGYWTYSSSGGTPRMNGIWAISKSDTASLVGGKGHVAADFGDFLDLKFRIQTRRNSDSLVLASAHTGAGWTTVYLSHTRKYSARSWCRWESTDVPVASSHVATTECKAYGTRTAAARSALKASAAIGAAASMAQRPAALDRSPSESPKLSRAITDLFGKIGATRVENLSKKDGTNFLTTTAISDGQSQKCVIVVDEDAEVWAAACAPHGVADEFGIDLGLGGQNDAELASVYLLPRGATLARSSRLSGAEQMSGGIVSVPLDAETLDVVGANGERSTLKIHEG